MNKRQVEKRFKRSFQKKFARMFNEVGFHIKPSRVKLRQQVHEDYCELIALAGSSNVAIRLRITNSMEKYHKFIEEVSND